MTEKAESPANHAIREARQLAFDELYRTPQTEFSLVMDDSFPEKFVDKLSRLEVYNKHLFRPNTYLHKWWARRCGSTFRAILKQFVPNVNRRDYYAPGGLEGKIVLDPMMGGGTTLHEAIRSSISFQTAEDARPMIDKVHAGVWRTDRRFEMPSSMGWFVWLRKSRQCLPIPG